MYFVRITIPKNTLVTAPIIEDIEIAPGILRKCEIVFPAGCVGLVGLWIAYRGVRIFPMGDFDYFRGNGLPIIFTPDYLLDLPPFVLSVLGFNEDDTYPHSPTVQFEIEFDGSFAREETKKMVAAGIPIGLPSGEFNGG